MKLQTSSKMLKLLTDVDKIINKFSKNKNNIELKKQVVDKIMLLSEELKKSDVKYVTWNDGMELMYITANIEGFVFNDLLNGPEDFYNKIGAQYKKEVFEDKLNVVIDFVVELPDILREEEDAQDADFYNKEKKYWDSFTRNWWASDKIPLYYKPKNNIKGRYRPGIKEDEKRDLQRTIFYSKKSWKTDRKSRIKTKWSVCLNNTKISLIDCAIPSYMVTIAKYCKEKNKVWYLVKQLDWGNDYRNDVEEYFIKGE